MSGVKGMRGPIKPSETGLKPSVRGLNDRQARFVNAYLSTGSIREAAQVAGYPHETAGYTVLRSSRVQASLRDYRERIINTDAANEALRCVRELMKVGNPPAVRLGAAKAVLAMAGHSEKPAPPGGKPLHEMSYDELHAIVQGANDVIEGRLGSDSDPESGVIPLPAPLAGEEDQGLTP